MNNFFQQKKKFMSFLLFFPTLYMYINLIQECMGFFVVFFLSPQGRPSFIDQKKCAYQKLEQSDNI